MRKTLFFLTLCGALVAGAGKSTSVDSKRGPTEVLFFFDTEDYTSDRANDSVVMIAKAFTDAGVRGHFAIVGYLAQKWMDYGRKDVVEALKPHLVGTQTLYHSLRPNILEMADERDYKVAYANVMKQEREGVELIKRALGRDDLVCIKADPRFRIVTLADKLPSKPRRPITRADLPLLRDHMMKSVRHVREPASWCVADVFHGRTRRILRTMWRPIASAGRCGRCAMSRGCNVPIR